MIFDCSCQKQCFPYHHCLLLFHIIGERLAVKAPFLQSLCGFWNILTIISCIYHGLIKQTLFPLKVPLCDITHDLF